MVLLVAATVRAQERGLIDQKPETAIDATGLESRHTALPDPKCQFLPIFGTSVRFFSLR